MTLHNLPTPNTGDLLRASDPSQDVLRFLSERRSAGKANLAEPGPDPDDLAALLQIAARVPDHRRVEPWRFITLAGDHRHSFGKRLADIAATSDVAKDRGVTPETSASLPLRAPVVVAVVSSPNPDHKTPVWEQELSAGAVCYNLVLAARAAGWGAVWLTDWIAYASAVDAVLGLKSGERIAGYIYIGTPTAHPPERLRPDMTAKVTEWKS